MKSPWIVVVLILLFAVSCRPEPSWPEPPEQHVPWHPDSVIPTNAVSAIDTLVAQGFPDPRGCEYRIIKVNVSSPWENHAQLVQTHGWLLPASANTTNRFAICWNGVIYPVVSFSDKADLHRDAADALTPGRNPPPNLVSSRFRHVNVFLPGQPDHYASSETENIFLADAQSTRLVLLLRCGEVTNALAQLTGWSKSQDDDSTNGWDPYLQFASDWAWAMFDHTIAAHSRRDEPVAFATALQLAAAQPQIEATCAQHGFKRPFAYSSYHITSPSQPMKPAPPTPYLSFLDQFPQILADLQRRNHESPRTPVTTNQLAQISNPARRVALLIENLDQVQATQFAQPGGVDLFESPIVAALAHEGDAAVDPLFDCIENDRRLTCSIGMSRDFFRQRTVISVKNTAAEIVHSILNSDFRGGLPEMRAYWHKYGHLKLADRCYAILADDSAVQYWPQAAATITQPVNVMDLGNGMRVTRPSPTNQTVSLRGESLRAKSNPSVSDLLARRALEVLPGNPAAYNISTACQFALDLLAWDPSAAQSVAATLSKRCLSIMQYSSQHLADPLARLTLARAHAGDPHAFDEYAAWLTTLTPEHTFNTWDNELAPLKQYPTNAVLDQAADKVFSQPGWTWVNLPWPRCDSYSYGQYSTGLFQVPAIRRQLVRALDQTNVCGSISWQMGNMIDYTITNQFNTRGSMACSLPDSASLDSQAISESRGREWAGAKLMALAGVSIFPPPDFIYLNTPAYLTRELRCSDWIALCLANAKQIPPFNPFASVAQRDAALQAAKIRLLSP